MEKSPVCLLKLIALKDYHLLSYVSKTMPKLTMPTKIYKLLTLSIKEVISMLTGPKRNLIELKI